MNKYLHHLAKTIAIGQNFNPQEEAQKTLDSFRKSGTLVFKIEQTDADAFNMVEFIDHVPFHLNENATNSLAVQDAYKIHSLTRANIIVQEIKHNLAIHCKLSNVSLLPANVSELLDELPEELTKLVMEFVFGELSQKLPTEKEYRQRFPNGLVEKDYVGQCGVSVIVLFDDNKENLSIIDNFGVNVGAFRFYKKKGQSKIFKEIFSQFHKDAE